jgi:hypothetical protein
MSLQQQLLDLGELLNFSDLSTFTQNIPIEWVASALDLSTQATIRRRRLPSDQVLWLVLGMALFRDEPVHEVARRLNICAQGLASHDLLARSGVTEARKRLGADPLEWLFRQTGNQWGCERYLAGPAGIGCGWCTPAHPRHSRTARAFRLRQYRH